MYGLVNQAIQQMVVEKFGEETWEKIRSKANAEDVFVAMDQYPDADTVNLVGASCEVLGIDAPTVLKTFGDYWVDFTGEAYGELFKMSGATFLQFVQNLNDLHSRVGQIMPELKPPSFSVTDVRDGQFTLHYHSVREGLFPMIEGLLKGLGRRFDTEVEVAHVRGRADGLDHDEFQVRYKAR